MIAVLAVLAITWPIVVALAIAVRPLRAAALAVAPWTMLPAIIVAFRTAGAPAIHADAILLGTTISVDDAVTRAFLVLTSIVWLAASLFARGYMADDPRRARFWFFFLITASGNVGLVLADDVASFYTFFSVMTFAAYGLVVHVQSDEARRAGRIYLAMALVGEMLLLAAFVMIVDVEVNLPLQEAPRALAMSPHRELVVALVLAGFGIKAGAIGLHVWLPLAHPVAPTPASAVLSGAMIKAGLLGWLRFLPLGLVAMPDAGTVCMVGGFTAAFYAVMIGLVQRDPKTILAYSSVSQMGFVTVALGVALAMPSAAPIAIPVILFYALHHALSKAALFLGTGIASAAQIGWQRALVLLGLVVSALDLAGAPLSSGALAKISLKHVLVDEGAVLVTLLSAGAIGSTLLMAKLLSIIAVRREPGHPRQGVWAPWLLLIVLDVAFLVWPPIEREQLELLVEPTNVVSALWPVLVGIAVAAVAHRAWKRPRSRPIIPPGDLLVIFEYAHRLLRRVLASWVLAFTRAEARFQAWTSRRADVEHRWGTLVRTTTQLERSMWMFAPTGAALLLLGILLAWAALR